MAIVLTDNAHYQAIADAIRAKNGMTTTYKPAEMAEAILAIAPGITLDELENPATAEQILSGYRAYAADGSVILGTAKTYEEGYADGIAESLKVTYMTDENGNLLADESGNRIIDD